MRLVAQPSLPCAPLSGTKEGVFSFMSASGTRKALLKVCYSLK